MAPESARRRWRGTGRGALSHGRRTPLNAVANKLALVAVRLEEAEASGDAVLPTHPIAEFNAAASNDVDRIAAKLDLLLPREHTSKFANRRGPRTVPVVEGKVADSPAWE